MRLHLFWVLGAAPIEWFIFEIACSVCHEGACGYSEHYVIQERPAHRIQDMYTSVIKTLWTDLEPYYRLLQVLSSIYCISIKSYCNCRSFVPWFSALYNAEFTFPACTPNIMLILFDTKCPLNCNIIFEYFSYLYFILKTVMHFVIASNISL